MNFFNKSALILLLILPLRSPSATLINGAGATFPYPLYSKWFYEYEKENPGVQINYQSIGSGGGIRQLLDRTIDFGASDVPMSQEQLAKAPSPVLHIPTVLGAVVISYHLPDEVGSLKLTSNVIADIFLGKITKWEDPQIAALNPGVKLSGDILVIHRSDGSGTSGVFTDYLTKVSPEWNRKVGQGTSVNWPVGLGAKGNEGVAGLLKQTKGALGYVELIYAQSNQLPMAQIKNRAGKFITPSIESVTKTAQNAMPSFPDDFRASLTDPEGPESYPLSSFTYLLVFKNMGDLKKRSRLEKFLLWAMEKGQGFAAPLQYSPLPEALAKKVEVKIATMGTGPAPAR